MNDEGFESLRRELQAKRRQLANAVKAACPGPHEPRQHRDRKPPWCPACGRDEVGRQQRASADDA